MFDIHRKEIEWGGRTLVLETGKMARQANGAVLVTYGGTTVLCTAVAESSPRVGLDFFPLTVNYQEKTFAAGKMPPCPGFAPCESFISIIFTFGIADFSENMGGEKAPASSRQAK